MNKRIRDLIEQAIESKGFLTAGDSVPPLPVREFNKEKFAELIIAECCVALHPMLRDMISRTQGVDMIVEHFRDKE